ncbi:glycosyltransferase family 4 protein [Thalassolituus sp. ST750PaO-4]|uniref:glycosyltransferase family 4 protein n=1 Tax=Thalassolituus sp. ST750PaO-4 TaxID=2742965 RepID=UPI001CE2E4ED|nr:glycosyltransferase family 4 protein [Thalassolituus sp. ST750PaO-4]MCA6058333.1 glycosyltransferase family 4 protein [Thalassolituus sp. ST750PaO-4]
MADYLFINQYASTPVEGFGGRYYYFSKVLQEHGEKVLLVTSSNHHLLRQKPVFNGLWHFSNYDGLDVLWLKTLPYTRANSPIRVINWFLFALYMPFLRLLKARPKQIHFSSPSPIPFLGVCLLSKLFKSKTVFDVRDVWPETLIEIGGISRRNLFVRFLGWVESFSYRNADVVTSNLANLEVRFNELGLNVDNFLWISNGVDIKGVEFSLTNSNIKLPIQCNNKKVIGYTGTLGEANSIITLLQVARLFIDKPEYVFLIVGSGKEQSSLISYCEDNNITNVIFMDAVTKADVYKVQSMMDVLCVGAKPSPLYRYGVSPNKLYEYIYSGVPVLYYIDTVGYHPVRDAGCGEQVTSSDLQEFYRAIIKLTSLSTEEYSLMKKNAQKYIIENHLYDNLALKLVDKVDKYVKSV